MMATVGLTNDRVNGPIKQMIISTNAAAFMEKHIHYN